MFDSADSSRLASERTSWVREQSRGKAPFMVRNTISFAALLSLLLFPILRNRPHGPNRILLVVVSYLLCFVLGYAGSELIWRRGLRLTRKSDTP
jgi:hypothetical protein